MITTTVDLSAPLIDAIASGKDGATVSVHGVLPEFGYYVGGVVPSLINPTPDQIPAFVSGARYAGMWRDTDGTLYVDVVDHVHSRTRALDIAAARGEMAIWDIARDSEVRV